MVVLLAKAFREPKRPNPRNPGDLVLEFVEKRYPLRLERPKIGLVWFGPRRPPSLSDALDAVFSRPDFLVEILQGSVLTGSPLKRFFSHPRLDK